MTEEQLAYSPAEVATRIGVHVNTVRRWLEAGHLPGRKVGGLWIVPAASLEAWLDSADGEDSEVSGDGERVPAEGGRPLAGGDLDGPRGNRTVMVRTARTRREARELLEDMRRLARPTVGSGRTTVGSYLRSWLDSAGRRSLKASTWRTYEVALRLHIEPAIGHIALANLTPDHVDHMLAGLDLEPKGQRNVLGFLGRVLDVALARGIVARNAARLVEPPRVIREEPTALTADQAKRILQAVRGDRLEALWVLALATGLRQAELLGLRWADVDLDDATIRVAYVLVRVDGEYRLDEPKSAKSRRTVTLPAFAVTALRDHRRRQLEERLAAGGPVRVWSSSRQAAGR